MGAKTWYARVIEIPTKARDEENEAMIAATCNLESLREGATEELGLE